MQTATPGPDPPRRFLLNPIGSAGDVHPSIHLGRLLLARGHEVTLIAADPFARAARAAGLDFAPCATRREYETMLRDPDIWHPRRASSILFREICHLIRPAFEQIRELARSSPRPATLVGSGLALGARLAREALGIPMVTVHLQPVCFLSAVDPPLIPGYGWIRLLPPALLRALLALPGPFDLIARRQIRDACRAAGVAPPRNLLREWWDSPDGVLALFPDWFAPPRPDWPAQTRMHGFPLEDLSTEQSLPPALSRFLDRGDPPIVFTFGSAMWHARAHFDAALEACRLLGRRAIFATRHAPNLPTPLPDSIHATDYAPFRLLLPRAVALVHHGGIGTMSQALAAGIPQLVMPMAHDQPDNARRMIALGVGARIDPRDFRGRAVARALATILDDPGVAAACTRHAALARSTPDPGPLVEWLASRTLAARRERQPPTPIPLDTRTTPDHICG